MLFTIVKAYSNNLFCPIKAVIKISYNISCIFTFSNNKNLLREFTLIKYFKNISLDYDYIFKGLPSEITVGRYHSLSLVEDTLPECLEIISKSKDDGEIMTVKHKSYNVYGLQFHPESILTGDGLTLMRNFLEKVERGIL